MSVGWGQSYTDNYTQEIIILSDEEVMIITNYEMEDYTYSDTTYISVSRLFPPCDDGYTEIDGECYFQSDLDVLQDFIDNSIETINMDMDVDSSGVIDPLELGDQYWSDGRITYLNCNSSGLSGEIPSEIGDLTNLTGLNLGNNQLGCYEYEFEVDCSHWWNQSECCITQCDETDECSGEIPESIGKLENLTNLNLGINFLSGEIPQGVWDMTNLNYLMLPRNELSGEIPNSIGNLEELFMLDLGYNQITGEIPNSIGNLTNLINLYLLGNNLSGTIPSEIGNLTNLYSFWLNSNQLTGSIPSEIVNMTNVVHLILENNQLSGELPFGIGDLINTVWFRISNNKLSGLIPESICGLNINWDSGNDFGISNNYFCPLYPECIEDYVGNQDTSECVECTPGDFTGDSVLSILDIISIVDFILETSFKGYEDCSDISRDGYLNILDVIILIEVILSQP